MGCVSSKERVQTKPDPVKSGDIIDQLAHEAPPDDIWDKIENGADGIARDLLFKWMDDSRAKARKMAIKEKEAQFIHGLLKLENFKASFKILGSYGLEVKIQDATIQTGFAAESTTPKWEESFDMKVSGKGAAVIIKLHQPHEWSVHILPLCHAEWHIPEDPSTEPTEITLNMEKPYLFGSEQCGTISFTATFTPTIPEPPQGDRGFIYASYLPVLDPDVPMPALAKPDKAFTEQDTTMTHIMAAIAVNWMVTGAINTRKLVPQPLTDRVDNGEGDEWWTNRRLNGDCPGFIQKNINKTDEEPWDYYIEWDFRDVLDSAIDVKSGVNWPTYIAARFVLKDEPEGLTRLKPHSIKYIKAGKAAVVVPAGETSQWKKAKNLWKSFEMNVQFTWTHVGVHFNVEQYAMAIYRNLSEGHPIWDLLMPHFKNVLTNNRLVVRPKTDGVVTEANVYSFGGQIKMLQARFANFSYKQSPDRVVPPSLIDNSFENTQEVMWNLITQYVDEYFEDHPHISIDSQIENMSKDLQNHALNKTPDSMTVTTVEELKQLSRYVIFQSIFYHAWVHWNNFDDFYPVLHFDREDTAAPPEKEAQKLEDKSNMIQTFVEFVSPSLKQWPILDPELGGPDRLQQLLWENASKINPAIQIATLIMAPNS